MKRASEYILAGLFSFAAVTAARQIPEAPPSPGPDGRFQADILVVVAHPDDETVISGYLARAIFDEKRSVAVIFTTRGDHGGNNVGYEQAASLGLVREMEARQALGSFRVTNVWFLSAPNSAAPDVLGALEAWRHGATLESTVRLVRLIRPKVILTWLPDNVVGENHQDHQAAGVIATEAFDVANDPTTFPEQTTPPRDRLGYGNLSEGLQPWQPQKLYYFSDALRTDFLKQKGPEYSTVTVSAARGVPYYKLVAEEGAFHLTQDGASAKKALLTGDFKAYQEPVRFAFGKSVVKNSVTGDIFEGVVSGPIHSPSGVPRSSNASLSSNDRPWVELGSPWAFYREFWKAHGIEHLERLLAPEQWVKPGQILNVPLLLRNNSDEPQKITLTATLPPGWKELKGTARYPIEKHGLYPILGVYAAPSSIAPGWEDLTWTATANGESRGKATLRVYLSY